MKRNLYSILAVILMVLPSAGIFSQQKHALVIGNSNYTGISKLNNPINDATDMAATLQSLGFTVEMVLDGDLEKMETAVNNLKRKLSATRNSYGFFFFAGHGVQANGQNYLIPLPANNIQNETHLRDRAVSLQFILDSLKEAGNDLNMIVLDACRDNPFGWSRSGARGLFPVAQAPTGSIVMYAAAPGQKADDGSGRNGLFTSHLLNNLKTAGLSVYEVFDKTMGDVKNVTGGRQDPELSLRFSGANSVYLGSRPTPNTPVQPAPSPQTVSLKQYSPRPENQGPFSTTVAWAVASALTISESVSMNRTSPQQISENMFSPYYIYRYSSNDPTFEQGMRIEDALEFLKKTGVVRRLPAETPVNWRNIAPSLYANARHYKILGYERLFQNTRGVPGTISEKVGQVKKSLLERRPVIIGMNCPNSFFYAKGVWQPSENPTAEYGGHAMCVVGYDDTRYGGAFEILNSWGTDWGNEGYIWISYKDFAEFVYQAYEMICNF